jgi:hypothetical protein
VVVDQTKQPGLEVTTAGELNEEWTFDIDVPELVGLAPLVPRTGSWRNAATAATVLLEEFINVGMADLVDLASLQLGGDSLGVLIGR